MADNLFDGVDFSVPSPTPTPMPTPMPVAGASANLFDDVPMTPEPAAPAIDDRRFTERHPWLSAGGEMIADAVGGGLGATYGTIASLPGAGWASTIGGPYAGAATLEAGALGGAGAGQALISNPIKAATGALFNSVDRALFNPDLARSANDHWLNSWNDAKAGLTPQDFTNEFAQGMTGQGISRGLGMVGRGLGIIGDKAEGVLGYPQELWDSLVNARKNSVEFAFQPGSKAAKQLSELSKGNFETVYKLPPGQRSDRASQAIDHLENNTDFFERVKSRMLVDGEDPIRATWAVLREDIGGKLGKEKVQGTITRELSDVTESLSQAAQGQGGVRMVKPDLPDGWESRVMRSDGQIDLKAYRKLTKELENETPVLSEHLQGVYNSLLKDGTKGLSAKSKAYFQEVLDEEFLAPSTSDFETLARAKKVFQGLGQRAYAPGGKAAPPIVKAYASAGGALADAERIAGESVNPELASRLSDLNYEFSQRKVFESAIGRGQAQQVNTRISKNEEMYGGAGSGGIFPAAKEWFYKYFGSGGHNTVENQLERKFAQQDLSAGNSLDPSMYNIDHLLTKGLHPLAAGQGAWMANRGVRDSFSGPGERAITLGFLPKTGVGDNWEKTRDMLMQNIDEKILSGLAFKLDGPQQAEQLHAVKQDLSGVTDSDSFVKTLAGPALSTLERAFGVKSKNGTAFGLVSSDQVPTFSRKIGNSLLSGKTPTRDALKQMRDLMDKGKAPE